MEASEVSGHVECSCRFSARTARTAKITPLVDVRTLTSDRSAVDCATPLLAADSHVFEAAALACDGVGREEIRPGRGGVHHAVLHQVSASMKAAVGRRRHGAGERDAQERTL